MQPMTSKAATCGYVVEGVRLPRPFRIRRLGHVGFNVDDLDACLRFYRELLGFRLSDQLDLLRHSNDAELRRRVGHCGFFLRHGTDHHSLVLVSKAALSAIGAASRLSPQITVNQITWQVNTLREVVNAAAYLDESGVRMLRTGRDTPGSNWHTYVFDPEGHVVELYYGIEQIGWNGRSKPQSLYGRGYRTVPPVPHMSEQAEIEEARTTGVAIEEGFADTPSGNAMFDVGGILLPRPFAIAGIGPLRLFVDDLESARSFYVQRLGFDVTGERSIGGSRVLFLRAGAEHHSLALYEKSLRKELPARQDTTTLSLGVRLGSYAQLRTAVRWLAEQGVSIVDMPAQLSPGVRHNAFVRDPEGHLIELYAEMELAGGPGAFPDGDRTRWPEAIEPLASTYLGEVFLGPVL